MHNQLFLLAITLVVPVVQAQDSAKAVTTSLPAAWIALANSPDYNKLMISVDNDPGWSSMRSRVHQATGTEAAALTILNSFDTKPTDPARLSIYNAANSEIPQEIRSYKSSLDALVSDILKTFDPASPSASFTAEFTISNGVPSITESASLTGSASGTAAATAPVVSNGAAGRLNGAGVLEVVGAIGVGLGAVLL